MVAAGAAPERLREAADNEISLLHEPVLADALYAPVRVLIVMDRGDAA